MARMELDEELCLCFHVSKRKVVNYLKVERPRRPSQLADCFGAGTGCGWCRTYLRRLFDEVIGGQKADAHDIDLRAHARERAAYIRSGGGTPPPGATPFEASGESNEV